MCAELSCHQPDHAVPENEERTNVICSLENWERSNDDAFVADILHADAQGLAVLIDLARAPSECGRENRDNGNVVLGSSHGVKEAASHTKWLGLSPSSCT